MAKSKPRSSLEATLERQLNRLGIIEGNGRKDFETELRFCAVAVGGIGKGVKERLNDAGLRDFRFDLAWPDLRLAVEVEGGVWTGGRHTRAAGFTNDCIKYNFASLMGWRVLRYTTTEINNGSAAKTIKNLVHVLSDTIDQSAEDKRNVYFKALEPAL